MQWMQLFLPCNEMPASGPRPLLWLIALVYRGMINDVTLWIELAIM